MVGQPDGEVWARAGPAVTGEESHVVYEVSNPAGYDDRGETPVTRGGLEGTVLMPAELLVSEAPETLASLPLTGPGPGPHPAQTGAGAATPGSPGCPLPLAAAGSAVDCSPTGSGLLTGPGAVKACNTILVGRACCGGGIQSPLRGASLKMTLEETLGIEQDLLLDFLPLPQVTEQEVQGLHWVQLSSWGHLSELHTEDSTLAP